MAASTRTRKRRNTSQLDARRFREAERLRKSGALDDAVRAYRLLLADSPRHVAALQGLATALGALGRSRQAARAARKAAEIRSENLCNIAEAAATYGRYAAAADCYLRAHKADPEGLEPVWGLAEVAHARGRMAESRRWLNTYLELDPGNPEAEHQLAALGARQAPDRAGDDYLVSHFDRFADNFDTNLVEELNYVGPDLLNETVSAAFGASAPLGAVLDLGCGTGLSGAPFHERATRLDGVDLSPEMVAKARKRRIYDTLDVAEVTAYLARARRRYDLVLAADLLVYFGDVRPVFEGAARVLRPGGHVACLTEWQRGNGYTLNNTGRFAHGRAHVRAAAAAAGFEELSARNDRLRDEYGKPVIGTAWLFRRV